MKKWLVKEMDSWEVFVIGDFIGYMKSIFQFKCSVLWEIIGECQEIGGFYFKYIVIYGFDGV